MKKTFIKLARIDENIFSISALCKRALKRNGHREEAKQLSEKFF